MSKEDGDERDRKRGIQYLSHLSFATSFACLVKKKSNCCWVEGNAHDALR